MQHIIRITDDESCLARPKDGFALFTSASTSLHTLHRWRLNGAAQ